MKPGALFLNFLMSPWALLLLIPVAALLLAELRSRTPGVMRVSTGETLAAISSHKRLVWRWVPAVLRALALALLVIALARPLSALSSSKSQAKVIDILLCVDISGSMEALDFQVGDEYRNRLDVAKLAVRRFIENRRDPKSDRFGMDRIGLILYGSYAWTQCPLTLDYDILLREVDAAFIDQSSARSQKTAIGSAIGLAVSRLRNSEAKSKVIILLTDGVNNAGEMDPITAAHVAQEYGIRIYTIGAGSGGETYLMRDTLFGPRRQRVNIPIDEETLRRVAEITGAKFYRATDTSSLQEAYDEINRLEATEIELDDYYDYEEGFETYAAGGTLLMALALFARRLWFEPIP